MRGWIYVMTNKSMPGLVKIGASTKDPVHRAQELRSTNNPHDFVIEYDLLVYSPFAVERATHEFLSHLRVHGDGQGREFFQCAAEDAVVAIRSLVTEVPLPECFYKLERELVEKAEEALSRHAAAEQARQEAEQIERLAEQEARRQAALAEQEAERRQKDADSLREQRQSQRAADVQRRIAARKEWLANQEAKIAALYKDRATRTNSIRMLHEGRLAICHCGRPRLQNYPLSGDFVCDGCNATFSIPYPVAR